MMSVHSIHCRRRLVALMFTDMVGYSALASRDEQLAFRLLEEHRALFRRIFPSYGGHENKTVGDAFFIEFGSVVEAVQCAVEIQTAIYERNIQSPPDEKLAVRIGIHLGDIIDFEGDSYGDGVNIAARVEGKASPGGVYITRQVADQVGQSLELPVRKVGTFQLKNIATPTDIYRIRFPWEAEETKNWLASVAGTVKGAWLRHRIHLRNENPIDVWKRRAVGALFVAVSAVLMIGVGLSMQRVYRQNSRGLASEKALSGPNRVSLLENWSFSLDPKGKGGWQSFDPRRPWEYADRFKGSRYWLKTEFTTKHRFQFPTMVLGLISGVHRAYLNGEYIGGSNLFAALEYYTFDPKILKTGGTNTLVVQVDSKKTLSPGITSLSDVGSYLGEFDDVHRVVFSNRIFYDLFRSVYLFVAFGISFICFLYYLTRREKIVYLYFSLYLLLGAMALAYYNTVVTSFLDYRYRRFLKVFSFSMSSLVLLSAYLNLTQKRKLELANNVLALVSGAVIAILLISGADAPGFAGRYNGTLWAAFAYTCCWALVVSWDFAQGALRDWREARPEASNRFHAITVIFFGAVMGVLLYSSLKSGSPGLLSPSMRSILQDLGITYPFFFAILVLIAGIRDYIRKTQVVSFAESRNNLILSIVRIASNATDLDSTISAIQQKVSEFIGAERSTIYLVEESEGERWLKATYLYGSMTHHLVEKIKQPRDGIIGYACTTRAPLLIRDLNTDLRFGHNLERRQNRRSYKTGSCMIFPLISGAKLIGILTVADKVGGQAFTKHDFALMHVVAKDLAMLIHNEQLSRLLREYAKAA